MDQDEKDLSENLLSGIVSSLLGGLANYSDPVELRRCVSVLAEDDDFWKGLRAQSDHFKRLLRAHKAKGAN